MKKILMIGTGGTIASEMTPEGLTPELSTHQLLAYLPRIAQLCHVDCIQLCSLDSTSIHPAHWLGTAQAIREHYDDYDGFVISHGTDTMAYTAAALSYLVQDSPKPIILTGAQKPIWFDGTDSKRNLTDAFLYACRGCGGVQIVFNGRVILGTRARKTYSKSFRAFSSVNYPDLAVVQDEHLLQYIRCDSRPRPLFYDRLDPHVGLLKLIPGTEDALAEFMLDRYDGLIIESFGVGGIPQRLMDAFAGHELHFITGHTHLNSNYDIREGVTEHNVAQVCGNLWWDPINWDGTPKGFQLFRECGGEFSWEYRSLGESPARQIRVWHPGQVAKHPASVVAKVWNWDSYWTVVWYEDGRYRGAMQRTTLDDPDYTAHIDSLKAAGRKISKVQRPRPTNFYFTARPSASAREVEVVATDRFGRRYSERIALGHTD